MVKKFEIGDKVIAKMDLRCKYKKSSIRVRKGIIGKIIDIEMDHYNDELTYKVQWERCPLISRWVTNDKIEYIIPLRVINEIGIRNV